MNADQFAELKVRGELGRYPRAVRHYLRQYAKSQTSDWQPLYEELLRCHGIDP